MDRTLRTVVAVIALLLGSLSLYLVIGSLNENTVSVESSQSITPVDYNEGRPQSGTFIPEGWTGLPLSYDNDLYKDPIIGGNRFRAAYGSLSKELLLMPQADFLSDSETVWSQIISKYTPIIGWNGFFDAFDEMQFKRNLGPKLSPVIHAFGEFLGRAATRPRHAVEISSRDILHKAPLHGSVWVSIEAAGASDIDRLFDLVYNELCYFKDDENMGNVWISCAHGVGHGIGNIFGIEDIGTAIDICALPDDDQFVYACATGVYMGILQSAADVLPRKTFNPCDTNRFPGACYRFKNMLFEAIFHNTTGACMTQPDMYHTIGCVWGDGHVDSRPVQSYFEACEEYLPSHGTQEPEASYHEACLDGFFSAHEVGSIPESPMKDAICEDLVDLPKSYKVCMNKKTKKLTQFSFGDEDIEFYNTELLERHYDPSLPSRSAEWLHEWDSIQMKMNNPFVTMQQDSPHAGHGGHN